MATCLVSVNPDLQSRAGHYLYLDRALAREAQARGWSFQGWGNRGLPLDLVSEAEWIRPVFRDVSASSLNHEAAHRQRFYEDLKRAVSELMIFRPIDEVILFVYAGHPCQLPGFWRLLENFRERRLRVVFNLYTANWEFERTSERFQFMADTLRRLLAPGAHLADHERFRLTADSAFVAAEAEASWRMRVPVLPFFSLASRDLVSPGAAPPQRQITVAYPSSIHRQRGVALFPEMVRRCQAASVGLQFVFRTCLPQAQLSAEEAERCRELESLGARVVHGNLTDAAMREFFAAASIILNPYPTRYFRDRTSANVADALVFGKPIVAARGTWAGNLIERLGCGETFEEANAESLSRAVMAVAADLPGYTTRAQLGGEEWARHNSIGAVLSFVERVRFAAPELLHQAKPCTGEWKDLLLGLLDSPSNFSPSAPPAPSPVHEPVLSEPDARRRRRMDAKLSYLEQQATAMRRAIEHYRASPVRALRLWLQRKRRRLSL